MYPLNDRGYDLLHKGTLAFARAEQQGMRIDVEYCNKAKKDIDVRIIELEQKFKKSNLYGAWKKAYRSVNTNSSHQLAHVLYDILSIKVGKTTDKGKGATDKETLQQLNVPGIEYIVQMRELKKIRDTYLEAFLREQIDGYIHPFYNLHTVKTFRSSSDRPNFQNIPKRDKEAMQIVRSALYPRPGHQLLEVDYSGVEVRVGACYHHDPNMISYIKDPISDMHGDMAEQLFLIDNFDRSIPEHKFLRGAAKNGFVFPEFYGDYYRNCADHLACKWGGLSKKKWKKGDGVLVGEGVSLADHLKVKGIRNYAVFEEHVRKIEEDFWGRRFAVYQAWKDKWWRKYQKRGYVDTLTGFRCSGFMSKKDCINYPIQGSAFHCLLWSFIELDRIAQEECWDTKLIGQIHDAIILDVAPNELEHVLYTIKKVACHDLVKAWDWITVPLDMEADLCDVDTSWADKKGVAF